jgi:hypothetical protein
MQKARLSSQQRRALKVMATINVVCFAVLAWCYFTSSEKMRPMYLVCWVLLSTLGIASTIGLVVLYRRYPGSKGADKDE